ncbi:MAG: M23 family metallopeptidase [Myxococcota bacterium]
MGKIARGVAVLGALLLCGAVHAERRCLDDAEVCLDTLSQDGTTRFVASNASALPYTFRVSVRQLKNLKASGAVPFRAVIAPGEERAIGTLTPRDARLSTGWSSSWSAAAGSMLARHDDAWRYRMPFGGDRARVLSQGVGGRFSHTAASHYAFDFSMPSGTPVLAARSGRVVRVRDGLRDSGRRKLRDDQANSVEVLHADGTVALYAHLRRGARVQVGDAVRVGQRIGTSGDSGFSTGPHLHFMVWQRMADLSRRSLPIRFHDGSTEGFVPTEGVAYAPARRDPTSVPAERAPAARGGSGGDGERRDDGACACPNGAVIHVDLPCSRVCGGWRRR